MTLTDSDSDSYSEREAADQFLQTAQFIQALEIYNRLIQKNPSDAQAWVGVGMVMVRTLQWEQAVQTFRYVLTLDPAQPFGLYGLAMALFNLGERQAVCPWADAACDAGPHDWRIHQFRAYVYASIASDPAQILDIYKAFGRRFADPLTARAAPLPPLTKAQKSPTRRLKVGYVSGDLRLHSVAFFMESVFAHHNASEVDVHVYSTGQRDSFTERIAAHVPHWFDVYELSDDALCKLIREHQIDVLVDLSGHTVEHRLFTFARRAAPVQVTWLGFMHPLGMKAMDYRLTDKVLAPPGSEAHFSERLFRLDCVVSYAPPANVYLAKEPPMREYGHPTLISLNNSKKVTDAMLCVWKRILELRPQAHLVLMAQEIDQEKAVTQMRPRLERLGFPLERIHVSKQLPLSEFMSLGAVADIALDTAPISGGTTTLHALWMGLPVVALEGADAMSGSTACLLRSFGYGDWVVSDADAYVAKVLALMDDPDYLQRHRQTVREQMQTRPMMDYAGRTAELERAYRLMWLNHLQGEARYLDGQHDMERAVKALVLAHKPGLAPLYT